MQAATIWIWIIWCSVSKSNAVVVKDDKLHKLNIVWLLIAASNTLHVIWMLRQIIVDSNTQKLTSDVTSAHWDWNVQYIRHTPVGERIFLGGGLRRHMDGHGILWWHKSGIQPASPRRLSSSKSSQIGSWFTTTPLQFGLNAIIVGSTPSSVHFR